jgi:hypothetical protein
MQPRISTCGYLAQIAYFQPVRGVAERLVGDYGHRRASATCVAIRAGLFVEMRLRPWSGDSTARCGRLLGLVDESRLNATTADPPYRVA